MKTLHLTLQKKWFDMILSGTKTEEYRDIKDYWCNRFCKKDWISFEIEIFEHALDYEKLQFKTITFTNGYGNDKPQFVIEFKGLKIEKGKSEWGAPPWKTFVLKLGTVFETRNCVNNSDKK